MPQPIHYSHHIELNFSEGAILQRPKLAPYIGAIAMHWNEMEARVAIFLAALLGQEATTVIKIYLALQSDGAKRATIDTVVDLKLPQAEKEKFQEIQRNIGKRYGERNSAIHGAWGVSPKYPDHLLLADIRESTAMFPEMMAMAGPGHESERSERLLKMQKSVLVYSEKDFLDIIERFKTTDRELTDFTGPFIAPVFSKIQP